MRTTSRGILTMYSPLRENMTTMVKMRATRVMGLILGMKTRSYQARSLSLMRVNRVRMPAMKGMPR